MAGAREVDRRCADRLRERRRARGGARDRLAGLRCPHRLWVKEAARQEPGFDRVGVEAAVQQVEHLEAGEAARRDAHRLEVACDALGVAK